MENSCLLVRRLAPQHGPVLLKVVVELPTPLHAHPAAEHGEVREVGRRDLLRLDHLERDPKLRHGRALLVLDLRRDVALVDVLRVLNYNTIRGQLEVNYNTIRGEL